jgi:hypothetical protein
MKKILWAAVILISTAVGTAAWAQAAPGKEKPQWILNYEKDHSGRHEGKSHPARKVGGTAIKGAKPVSPPPQK